MSYGLAIRSHPSHSGKYTKTEYPFGFRSYAQLGKKHKSDLSQRDELILRLDEVNLEI